ncbi:MAG TPA: ABC transporter permease [Methanothermobacter sp.]|jgi:ABC-2 type transport system permease protein|uniref:ABC transporter n=1 Tax=Methanothermobacter tenebrarum TaxID=680118 RepID=A0ABM7YFF0_9EURY|nr:ABC transporter permease [Methanothermobacter tenebrarum]MDD3454652.1 ABC transporter permease [Methanobacteriales archaeon]MDX9692739.1 ABC transporter permease [Methanothermobacter sp.]BDH80118.1 ABC transporter [Methanothermobacter tenebrarum]HHW15923.1 ABC transporter permease [Methanothermobacter sp.]
MKLVALSRKEAYDILTNRVYVFLVIVQVIILLGSFALASVSSVALDPELIDKWGGGQFLKVGVPEDIRGTILEKNLKEENLKLVYYSDLQGANRALGLETSATVYLMGDGDVGVNIDAGSIFYTILSEKIRRASESYNIERSLGDLPSGEIDKVKEPIRLSIVEVNKDKGVEVAIESLYFVGIMYGFMVPFILFLPFFLGSNIVTDSIVGEKERKTFEVLLMTPLSSYMIILGKIIPIVLFSVLQSLAWILVLYLLHVPLYNLPLIVLLLFFMALGFAGVGVFVSSLVDSTKEANSAITIILFIATFILFVPLFMDVDFLGQFIDFIPSVVLVKLSTSQSPGGVIVDMLPSLLFSILVFVFSTFSFKREGLIRL